MSDESQRPETKSSKKLKILKIIALFMVGLILGVFIGSIVFDFNPLTFEFGLKRHESVESNTMYYSTRSPYTQEPNYTATGLRDTTTAPTEIITPTS